MQEVLQEKRIRVTFSILLLTTYFSLEPFLLIQFLFHLFALIFHFFLPCTSFSGTDSRQSNLDPGLG